MFQNVPLTNSTTKSCSNPARKFVNLLKSFYNYTMRRNFLLLAIIYVLVRLVIHGAFLVELAQDMEDHDLELYLDASSHLTTRQDLYISGPVDRMEFFQYSPAYALAFTPFLWLSIPALLIVHTLIHIIEYGLFYWLWRRIFHRMGFDQATEVLSMTLPVWLIFSAFWSDLGYLNVYILMALLATLLIDAILNERLGWSLLWLSIILPIKPQWAFAAAVPLLLGRYPFFFKLLTLAVIVYVAIAGLTLLVVGPSYGWQQYVDYFDLLNRLQNASYPWRGPDAPFLGYNHSIVQIVIFVLGLTPHTMRLATGIKVLLLVPLAIVSLRYLFQPVNEPGRNVPQLGLDLGFALYLGAFIWLNMVWEVSLGIAIFTYLLVTLKQRNAKILIWLVFLPYALIDLFQVSALPFFLLGKPIILSGIYVLTDPSIYLPLVMIVILTFYALLIKRLLQVEKR
ncbi:MAG: DUF2029 domain-containing protein [Chloroflexi bacterium]|nr:DUF2029 domain-containing protein [Chloroflexota bacterium]